MSGAERWGVMVLQANAEMDCGDIWATVEFALPRCSKSSAYRTEVADAALQALLLAVERFDGGSYRPEPLDYSRPGVTGMCRPPCRQADRRIDWPADSTTTVLAKLRAADSSPGVMDVIDGTEYFLFGGYEEAELRGTPGAIVAHRDGAICRATVDGAVWIPQLRRRTVAGGPGTFKLAGHHGAGRINRRCTGGPRAPGNRVRPAHVSGDQLPGIGRRRLPGILIPRRRHEHQPMPSVASRLPVRAGSPGAGHRARCTP